MKQSYTPITRGVRLSHSMFAALKRESAYQDVPMSQITRDALSNYLRRTFASRGEAWPGDQQLQLSGQLEWPYGDGDV